MKKEDSGLKAADVSAVIPARQKARHKIITEPKQCCITHLTPMEIHNRMKYRRGQQPRVYWYVQCPTCNFQEPWRM